MIKKPLLKTRIVHQLYIFRLRLKTPIGYAVCLHISLLVLIPLVVAIFALFHPAPMTMQIKPENQVIQAQLVLVAPKPVLVVKKTTIPKPVAKVKPKPVLKPALKVAKRTLKPKHLAAAKVPVKKTVTKAVKKAPSKAEIARQKAAQARFTSWQNQQKQQAMIAIQNKISANWINLFNQENTLQVQLKIQVNTQTGAVENVSVAKSSGVRAFDNQAMMAVRRATPLPLPENPGLANAFSVIKLSFNNRDKV